MTRKLLQRKLASEEVNTSNGTTESEETTSIDISKLGFEPAFAPGGFDKSYKVLRPSSLFYGDRAIEDPHIITHDGEQEGSWRSQEANSGLIASGSSCYICSPLKHEYWAPTTELRVTVSITDESMIVIRAPLASEEVTGDTMGTMISAQEVKWAEEDE